MVSCLPRIQCEIASKAKSSRSAGSGEPRQSSISMASDWRRAWSAMFHSAVFSASSVARVMPAGGQAAHAAPVPHTSTATSQTRRMSIVVFKHFP